MRAEEFIKKYGHKYDMIEMNMIVTEYQSIQIVRPILT